MTDRFKSGSSMNFHELQDRIRGDTIVWKFLLSKNKEHVCKPV